MELDKTDLSVISEFLRQTQTCFLQREKVFVLYPITRSVVVEVDSGTNASLDCKFFMCLCVGKH